MKIKIILTGKENLKKEILEAVAEQGKKQGLRYRKFKDFGDALFECKYSEVFEIVKEYFDLEIKQ